MRSKVIHFDDGFSVEAEFSEEQMQQIVDLDDLNLSKKFKEGLDEAGSIISATVNNVTSIWSDLNEKVKIDYADIELGVGFEAEGKVFVVKGGAKANINIKIRVSPKS